jgi:hypothetical protein
MDSGTLAKSPMAAKDDALLAVDREGMIRVWNGGADGALECIGAILRDVTEKFEDMRALRPKIVALEATARNRHA